MFNIGAGELTVIVVLALLILGPKRLPELARGLGKFVRELRAKTDEVRSVMEREFYRMDQELPAPIPKDQLPPVGPHRLDPGSAPSAHEPPPGQPKS